MGLCALSNVNDNLAYQYKATFENPNIITHQSINVVTDDDNYWFYFDCALNFNFYYNSDTAIFDIKDLHFVTTINRAYYDYPSTSVSSYSIDLDCGDYNSTEFIDLVYDLEYSMTYEDDRCYFKLFNASNTLIESGYAVCIPDNEEFSHSYVIKYQLDFSLLYNQLLDFVRYSQGYAVGYEQGYTNGYQEGNSDGVALGYQTGYTDGYTEGATQDETAVAIFSGIISIALIPINFFLACLNFEVFGINIGAFVSALLTIAIVVIITRMIVQGGNGGDK